MSLRISSCWLAVLLASCGDAQEDAQPAVADAPKIACALQGAADFSEICSLSKSATPRGIVLTLSAPDGGFRRLLLRDGQGVIAADGAEPAVVGPLSAGQIEVRIGGDRYRLPAAVE